VIIQFFRVLEGAVVFSINGGEDVILASGGTIQIPHPNHYSVKNISGRVACLFFVMIAPSTPEEEEEINVNPVRRAYYDGEGRKFTSTSDDDLDEA
jgi:mannose-6-phosphate isomerase-like protein (cupin superfamily)